MADRRAEYRFRNGTVWDRLLFSVMESCIIDGWIQNIGNDKGYRKLPGGLIIQFGKYTVTANANQHVDAICTLPIAFPSKKLYANATALYDGDFNQYKAANFVNVDNTLNSVRITNPNGFAVGSSYQVYVIAIGC